MGVGGRAFRAWSWRWVTAVSVPRRNGPLRVRAAPERDAPEGLFRAPRPGRLGAAGVPRPPSATAHAQAQSG
jgi:hypothetical protein